MSTSKAVTAKADNLGFVRLNPGELRLIKSAKEGSSVDLTELSEKNRIIRPQLLRKLCLTPEAVTPFGVRVSGAIFNENLILNGIDIDWPLYLDNCMMIGICLRGKIGDLVLDSSKVTGCIDAQMCQCRGFWSMKMAEVVGELIITNARIEGPLIANGAKIRNAHGKAVMAQGICVDSWFMEQAEVDGEFFIADGRIKSQFIGIGAKFRNAGGDAVMAQGIFANAWFMDGAEIDGAVHLANARIEGQFSAVGTKFRNSGYRAILAEGISAKSWLMNLSQVDGRFSISQARIEGQFVAKGACFSNPGDDAIMAQSVCANDWLMQDGCKVHGMINLAGAIFKHIEFSDTTISKCSGVAIRLDGATIEGALVTEKGFRAVGALVLDGLKAESAKIGFRHAIIVAHVAGEAHAIEEPPRELVARRVYEKHRLNAISAVETRIGRFVLPETVPDGIVDLSRARIGTLEDFASGWAHPEKEVFWMDEAGKKHEISHIVLGGTTYEFLENPDGEDDGDSKVLARYRWFDFFIGLPAKRTEARFRTFKRALFGLPPFDADSDTSIPAIWERRRNWLLGQHSRELDGRFDPQPWRQLARTLAAQGYSKEARMIAIKRRVRERMDSSARLHSRSLNWLLELLADYGFNPWKTVFWSAGLIIAFGALYAWASREWGTGEQAHHFIPIALGDIANGAKQGHYIYPDFNPWLYSLDQFIPLLDLGMAGFWRPAGHWLYIASVVEQFIGAFLVALSITGFTGLLTRDEPGV